MWSLLKHAQHVFFAVALWAPMLAFARPIDASVMIEVVRPEPVVFAGFKLPREGVGMGTVVDGGVLTAAHVVFGATGIRLLDAEGRESTARIVAIDFSRDAALLAPSQSFPGRSLIGERAAATGEVVQVVPRWEPRQEDEPVMSRAQIQTTKWSNSSVAVPLMMTGIKGETGMSGGGLFDARGRIVGIIVRIHSQLGYLFAVPIAEVCASVGGCQPAEK